MSKVVKGPGSRTPSANPAGGIEEILGGLLGGGGLDPSWAVAGRPRARARSAAMRPAASAP